MEEEIECGLYYEELLRILEGQNLKLNKDTKILEIGSGNAKMLDYFKKLLGKNVVGVDVRSRGNRDSPQVIARAEQLPFADQSFDVIFSVGAFDQEIYNQDQLLMMQEIARVLKHGGIFVAFADFIPAEVEGLNLIESDRPKSVYKKS